MKRERERDVYMYTCQAPDGMCHRAVRKSSQQPAFEKNKRNVNDCSAAHVVSLFVASGDIMKCRLLK